MKSILDSVGINAPSYAKMDNDMGNEQMETAENPIATADSPDEIEIYTRPNKDGRFIVKMGEFAVAILGTEAEDYFVSRFEIQTSLHTEPLFNMDQLSKGNLQYVNNPPEGLTNQILKLVNEFSSLGENLSTYNPYG